ncbi:hypothetical protein PR202_ga07320 [Eleusine coracana subsp. coracana]|uniref:Uncharacterized protein n=1 Tax=Eleusine coracana subsp. coracana TaxID=191504 RepID=A0AAV5BZQ9_ELECO|nr:hypothetical protein PR202_ga07320 [Eleusine coracana subsp. coracana]
MPCCQTVLCAAAAAAASRTPSWLHRLHAKEGLSFPSHLQIDDLLYGGRRSQPPPPLPPPPPPSSNHLPDPAVVKEPPPLKAAKPKQQQQQRPPRNPSRPNPSSSNSPQPQPQPQPQPPLTAVISDVFAVPSSVPLDTPALKAFRKQSRPRPRTDDQPTPAPPAGPRKDKKDRIAKAKKRRRAERAGNADGERCSRTDVTVIDTSTEGWKAAKVLIRKADVWKIRDKKPSATSEHEDALNKSKRRAGLVSKLQRDREKEKQKEKEATSPGNIDAGSDFVMKESEDLIQTLNR